MPEGWTAANGTIQQPAVSSCPAPASAISAGSNAAAGAAGAWTSPASSMLFMAALPLFGLPDLLRSWHYRWNTNTSAGQLGFPVLQAVGQA